MNCSVLWNPRKFYAGIKRRVDLRRSLNQAIKTGRRRFGKDSTSGPILFRAILCPVQATITMTR